MRYAIMFEVMIGDSDGIRTVTMIVHSCTQTVQL